MAITPDSSGASYLPAEEFLKRNDARHAQDLVSDAGMRQDINSLAYHPHLTAALEDASGDVEAACLKGKRYTAADLAALAGVSKKRLYRIVGRLAMCYLWERRPDKGPIPETYKSAREDLKAIAIGVEIFGTVEHEEAGLLASSVDKVADIERRNLTQNVALRYYGARGDRLNG